MEDESVKEFRRVAIHIAKDFGADITPEIKATFKSLTTKREIAKYRDELIQKALDEYED
jgi:hypothetical protein